MIDMQRECRLLIVSVVAVVGLLSSPTLAGTFSGVTLGEAGASGLNLAVFVTGPTSMNASNSSTLFSGNLGLAHGASTNFSGNGTLSGTLYKDPGATVQSNIALQFHINGGIVTTTSPNLVAQAVTDVVAAALNAKNLTADQTFTSLGSSPTTITDAGGHANAFGGIDKVVSVTNNISITNPSNNLTISGGVNDFLIIDVLGTISVTNGQIALAGGITADHVLFNVLGTGNSVSLSNGQSVLNGTYLAPNVGQKITLAPGTVNGAIIGYQIQTSSGPKVNGDVYGYPVAHHNAVIPEPSSVIIQATLMAVIGLVGLARRQRRRAA